MNYHCNHLPTFEGIAKKLTPMQLEDLLSDGNTSIYWLGLGPDFNKHHPKKQATFQIQATITFHSDQLSGSLLKRSELECVYHYIFSNVYPSVITKSHVVISMR